LICVASIAAGARALPRRQRRLRKVRVCVWRPQRTRAVPSVITGVRVGSHSDVRQPEHPESYAGAAMVACGETYCPSRHAAAVPLISADSRIGKIGRAVNFKKGVHGAIVFAKSDALLASINATPPPPSAKP
jgi:hypothetical protein